MDKHELSKLLITASIVDHRNVEPETVNMWHEIIGHLDIDFAYQAVVQHFRDSTDYLKPAHITRAADMIQMHNDIQIEEAKRRGLVGQDHPTNKMITAELRDRLDRDREARPGIDAFGKWYIDEEALFNDAQSQGKSDIGYALPTEMRHRYWERLRIGIA